MSFAPISEAFKLNQLYNISVLATDLDGTLTQQGKLTATLLQTLEALDKAEISVVIVTGRAAGWVEAIRSYLPVRGAIAENGGVFYSTHSEIPELLTPIQDLTQHRQKLAATFQTLKTHFPQIQEAADNRFRLTDWTFDVEGLTTSELKQLEILSQREGWSFTYSTVQCHIKPLQQNKAASLRQVLNQYFAQLTAEQILTIGDSPNDESLFDPSQFPFSVGVANVLHYRNQLRYEPAYVTMAEEAEGFSELANLVIQSQGKGTD